MSIWLSLRIVVTPIRHNLFHSRLTTQMNRQTPQMMPLLLFIRLVLSLHGRLWISVVQRHQCCMIPARLQWHTIVFCRTRVHHHTAPSVHLIKSQSGRLFTPALDAPVQKTCLQQCLQQMGVWEGRQRGMVPLNEQAIGGSRVTSLVGPAFHYRHTSSLREWALQREKKG